MSSTDNIIILKSSDGETFKVKEAVALQSRTIYQMIKEMDVPAKEIPLPNVTGKILSKVIDYCKMHVVDTDRDSSVAGDDLKDRDPLQCPSLTHSSVEDSRLESGFGGTFSAILSKVIKYCKKNVVNTDRDSSVAGDDLKAWDAEFLKVDQATLFDLILAANYLNIRGLLDLTCRTVADMIKGKTPEKIAKTFHIEKGFTSEEEEEIRRENQWDY